MQICDTKVENANRRKDLGGGIMRQEKRIATTLCVVCLAICLAAPVLSAENSRGRVSDQVTERGQLGVTAPRALADPSDSLWAPLGSGLNGPVLALAIYNNKLIAGGNFTTAGGNGANYIAAWDGSVWTPLGTGTNYAVCALTVYNNQLIAGGGFDSASGVRAVGVAAWDGNSWTNLAGGIVGAVNALTVFDNKVIVGGNFVSQGDTNIAAWDGSTWSALGSGIPDVSTQLPINGVMSLSVYNNLLIAGGDFGDPSFPLPYHYVASWDGNSWSDLNYPSGTVTALGQFGGKLISGGGRPSSWDGSSWTVMDTGLATAVAAYANFGGRLIAGTWTAQLNGHSLGYVIAWDGTSWKAYGSGTNGGVDALTIYNGKLIAGGVFTTAGNKLAANIAQRSPSCCQGIRGNVNCHGGIDLSDLSSLVSYLTGGGYKLCCFEAANINGVGGVDLGDLTAIVSCLTGSACPTVPCP